MILQVFEIKFKLKKIKNQQLIYFINSPFKYHESRKTKNSKIKVRFILLFKVKIVQKYVVGKNWQKISQKIFRFI